METGNTAEDKTINSEELSEGKMGDEDDTAEDKTINSEEISERKMGDKDDTDGLKEEDKIMQVLSDMHEDVPLGDPGPGTAKEDGGEGAAGATQ